MTNVIKTFHHLDKIILLKLLLKLIIIIIYLLLKLNY